MKAFKVVQDRGNHYVSAYATGTLQKRYYIGLPTKPDVSCLYAFTTFAAAQEFIDKNDDIPGELVIFECEVKKSRSRNAFKWLINDNTEYKPLDTIKRAFRKIARIREQWRNAIPCSEITLIREA